MGKSKGSLKGYEFSNLLFFLVLIIALTGGCWWVFYHFGSKNREVVVNKEPGISSEQTTGDITLFYLEGFRITEITRRYRNRLEVPVTDDGLILDLFNLPGVEEITIQPQLIIVKKNGAVDWDKLRAPIRDIVKNHLHPHY